MNETRIISVCRNGSLAGSLDKRQMRKYNYKFKKTKNILKLESS